MKYKNVTKVFLGLFGNILFTINVAAQFWEPVNAPIGGSKVLDLVDGKLYTCSHDTSITPSTNQKISFYNGSVWDTLVGITYSGQAFAFAKYNGQLHVGGSFRHIGTQVPNLSLYGIKNLAKWDGVKFDSIGAFPNYDGKVNELIVYNNELYIGGKFQDGGGIGLTNLMKYDGTSFSAVGGGITGNFTEVYAMTIYNGDLIVAGSFFTAGGVPVQNIARWNGSQWFAMGNGLSPYIFTMTVDTINDILYAGGNVGASGSVTIDRAGWWDGQNWQQIGNGLQAPGGPCLSLCMYKNELYAGTGADAPNIIKKWNGQSWLLLPSYPTHGGVYALTEFQGSLYASGTFNEIDSVCCYNGNARFTDTNTVSLPQQMENNDNTFTIHPNPTSDYITLSFSKPLTGNSDIVIYNVKGEVVLRKSFSIIQNSIEMALPENLSNGLYMCKVTCKGVEFTKGFVVE